MRSRATMRDVAALADVSVKTVSRVVNGESGVSPELADRVHCAVSQLSYRHNQVASSLRRGPRTLSVGVLVQDVGNDYSAAVLRAVEDAVRARGVAVFAASLDEEPERERELVADLVSRRVDGLVLMPASDDQTYLGAEVSSGLKVVVIDRVPAGLAADSVEVDNRGGARDAVRHLLSAGHRRIAMLGDLVSIRTAAHRLAGYRDALGEAGIARDVALECMGLRDSDAASRAVGRLLASNDPPTAIFSGRNVLSVGAVRGLRVHGRSFTVALVGFDDFPLADLLEPAVTVIRQDIASIGQHAAEMLLERLGGFEEPARELRLDTELVPRGSGEIPPPRSA